MGNARFVELRAFRAPTEQLVERNDTGLRVENELLVAAPHGRPLDCGHEVAPESSAALLGQHRDAFDLCAGAVDAKARAPHSAAAPGGHGYEMDRVAPGDVVLVPLVVPGYALLFDEHASAEFSALRRGLSEALADLDVGHGLTLPRAGLTRRAARA